MHFAGHGDVAFKLSFLAADGLVEAGVFNGDGDLRTEGRQHALVFFIEEGGAGMFEVEHADYAALVEERHNELRAGLGVHRQVARILVDFGHVDGSPLTHGRAHQAAVDGNTARGGVGVAESPDVAGDERFALLVEQHDGEHLVVDEAA